jgi:hypothetical protein
VKAVAHEPSLVRFRYRTFEYICDAVYSQLETTGAVPYHQTIANLLSATRNFVLLTSDLRRWPKRSPLAGVRSSESRSHSLD